MNFRASTATNDHVVKPNRRSTMLAEIHLLRLRTTLRT